MPCPSVAWQGLTLALGVRAADEDVGEYFNDNLFKEEAAPGAPPLPLTAAPSGLQNVLALCRVERAHRGIFSMCRQPAQGHHVHGHHGGDTRHHSGGPEGTPHLILSCLFHCKVPWSARHNLFGRISCTSHPGTALHCTHCGPTEVQVVRARSLLCRSLCAVSCVRHGRQTLAACWIRALLACYA